MKLRTRAKKDCAIPTEINIERLRKSMEFNNIEFFSCIPKKTERGTKTEDATKKLAKNSGASFRPAENINIHCIPAKITDEIIYETLGVDELKKVICRSYYYSLTFYSRVELPRASSNHVYRTQEAGF